MLITNYVSYCSNLVFTNSCHAAKCQLVSFFGLCFLNNLTLLAAKSRIVQVALGVLIVSSICLYPGNRAFFGFVGFVIVLGSQFQLIELGFLCSSKLFILSLGVMLNRICLQASILVWVGWVLRKGWVPCLRVVLVLAIWRSSWAISGRAFLQL